MKAEHLIRLQSSEIANAPSFLLSGYLSYRLTWYPCAEFPLLKQEEQSEETIRAFFAIQLWNTIQTNHVMLQKLK